MSNWQKEIIEKFNGKCSESAQAQLNGIRVIFEDMFHRAFKSAASAGWKPPHYKHLAEMFVIALKKEQVSQLPCGSVVVRSRRLGTQIESQIVFRLKTGDREVVWRELSK